MAIKFARRYCVPCEQYVLAQKQGPNHILHLLLSLITFGVWVPVWIIVTVWSWPTPYRCPTCGDVGELIKMTAEQRKQGNFFAFLVLLGIGFAIYMSFVD